MNTLFDANKYFEDIVASNKLLVDNGFKFTRLTSQAMVEEIHSQMQKHPAILALNDISDGNVQVGRGGTYYRTRVFTVHLFKRCKYGHMDDYIANLNLCRTIMQSIFSKMILDADKLANELIYMDVDRMPFQEYDKYLLNGHSGVLFMFNVKEPVSLCYNKSEWL